MGAVRSSKDLLMLLLYAKGHTGQQCEPISGRTRLMKMVFLFEKEIRTKFNLNKVVPKEALPGFIPHDFGPFSATVYADLEFLVELGFVERQFVGEGADILPEESLEYEYWQAGSAASSEGDSLKAQEQFSLTLLGRQFVKEQLVGVLSNDQWRVLDEFKARCTSAPLRAILRYVYTRYEKTTVKSKIREEILSSRET